MEVAVVVITECRLEYLHRTMESFEANNDFPFDHKIIINDSNQEGGLNYLKEHFPKWLTMTNYPKAGLAGAIIKAWKTIPTGVDYIFHLEEDFTFNEPINVPLMIDLIEKNNLAQMLLKRQPSIFNPIELECGGYIESDPDSYIEHVDGDVVWTEHFKFFSLNPCIYPYWVTEVGWPEHGSEFDFFAKLNEAYPDTLRMGILGGKFDPPKVHHIGDIRSDDWTL